MSYWIKVFVCFLILVIVAAFLHILSAYQIYTFTIEPNKEPKLSDIASSLFFAFGLAFSILLFPIFAYFIRQKTKSAFFGKFVLILVSLFPLIVACGFWTKQHINRSLDKVASDQTAETEQSQYEFRKTLFENSKFSIEAFDGKVSNYSQYQSLLKFSLRIRNAPSAIKNYKIEFSGYILMTKDDETSSFIDDADNMNIEASFENDKWIFRKFYSQELISEDAENIPLQIKFNHSKIANNYPKAIRITEISTPAIYESLNANYSFLMDDITIKYLQQ